MIRVRKTLAAFAAIPLLTGGGAPADAAGMPQESLFYEVTAEGEAVITGCPSGRGELAIPSSVDGFPVAGIGEGAFADRTDIRRLSVGEGIRYIAADAFAGCAGLEEIELGEGLQYIGSGAFSGDAGLEGILLPDSVLYVGEEAFGGTGLLAVSFPEAACVDGHAFEGSAWQELRDGRQFRIRGSLLEGWDSGYPVLEIPYGVTEIAAGDWMGRGRAEHYTEIILPDTLTEMGSACFNTLGTDRLLVPQGVREIEGFTFKRFSADEIRLPEGKRDSMTAGDIRWKGMIFRIMSPWRKSRNG